MFEVQEKQSMRRNDLLYDEEAPSPTEAPVLSFSGEKIPLDAFTVIIACDNFTGDMFLRGLLDELNGSKGDHTCTEYCSVSFAGQVQLHCKICPTLKLLMVLRPYQSLTPRMVLTSASIAMGSSARQASSHLVDSSCIRSLLSLVGNDPNVLVLECLPHFQLPMMHPNQPLVSLFTTSVTLDIRQHITSSTVVASPGTIVDGLTAAVIGFCEARGIKAIALFAPRQASFSADQIVVWDLCIPFLQVYFLLGFHTTPAQNLHSLLHTSADLLFLSRLCGCTALYAIPAENCITG